MLAKLSHIEPLTSAVWPLCGGSFQVKLLNLQSVTVGSGELAVW